MTALRIGETKALERLGMVKQRGRDSKEVNPCETPNAGQQPSISQPIRQLGRSGSAPDPTHYSRRISRAHSEDAARVS